MAGLELADVIQHPISNIEEAANSSMSILKQRQLQSAVRILQQQAIDMLWRLDEKAIAIRWMLGHDQVRNFYPP